MTKHLSVPRTADGFLVCRSLVGREVWTSSCTQHEALFTNRSVIATPHARRSTTIVLPILCIALVAPLASAGEAPRFLRAETTALEAREITATLAPATSIEREIGPGQQHTFRIQLQTGQAARLLVEQRGVDVAV